MESFYKQKNHFLLYFDKLLQTVNFFIQNNFYLTQLAFQVQDKVYLLFQGP